MKWSMGVLSEKSFSGDSYFFNLVDLQESLVSRVVQHWPLSISNLTIERTVEVKMLWRVIRGPRKEKKRVSVLVRETHLNTSSNFREVLQTHQQSILLVSIK